MQLNTNKRLGKGFNGTVYACKYNKKPAVCKIEKYVQSDGRFERQQRFDTDIASKHIDRFLKLEMSSIINNCKYVDFTPDIKKVPKIAVKYLKQRIASTQCSMLIYTPVLHYRLSEVKPKLSDDQRKAIYSHLKKSVDIMHVAGWHSNDLHDENIMCSNWRNPTSYYIIDYGELINQHNKLRPIDKTVLGYSDDYISLVWAMIYESVFDELLKKKLDTEWDTIVKKCRKFYPKGKDIKVMLDMYINRYNDYLEIVGCTPSMIAKAKQDPLAVWLYNKL
jgi:serine/threonine protein kinase